MPRKQDPSFEVKKIIWDIAATMGLANYSAIERAVDAELKKLRRNRELSEETPDQRKIKDIILNDIQKLSPEAVIVKLPRHMWRLRNDYEAILQLTGGEDKANHPIPEKSEARKRHIQRLIELSKKFRNRIVNPEIENRIFPIYKSTWYRLGQDWRFAPVAWLDIVTPYLGDNKMIERDFPGYNSFKQHILGIPFWSQYEKLHNECNSLDSDIDKGVDKLGFEDFPTYDEFIGYKSFLDDFPFERGLSPKRVVSQIEITPLNSDDSEFLEKVFQKLTKYVPDYGERLVKLENSLQQLWDDLDPDDIEPRIENGTCPKCFPKILQDVKE